MILNFYCFNCKYEFRVNRIDDNDFSPAACPVCEAEAKLMGQKCCAMIIPYDPRTSPPNGFREREWAMKKQSKEMYLEDKIKQNIKAHKPNLTEV